MSNSPTFQGENGEVVIELVDPVPSTCIAGNVNVLPSSPCKIDDTFIAGKGDESLGDGVKNICIPGPNGTSKYQEDQSLVTGARIPGFITSDDNTTPRGMKTPGTRIPMSARGTTKDKLSGAITAQYLREKRGAIPPKIKRTTTAPQIDRIQNSMYSPSIHNRFESTRNSFDMCIGMNGHDEDIVVTKIDGVEITQSDVEKLVEETMDSTIENLNLLAGYNYQKSFWFKGIDNTLYIFIQLLLLATSTIGVYQAASNTGGDFNSSTGMCNDSDSDTFIVVGVMGLVAGFIVEFGRRYKFDRRAITLYTCAQDFEAVISELRELHFNPLDPREKLHRIHLYQRHIDTIEKRAFDSQFIMSRVTGGNKPETLYIKPGDIPIEE
jgi:hypothetical protein